LGKYMFIGFGLALLVWAISTFKTGEDAKFLYFLGILTIGISGAIGTFFGTKAYLSLRRAILHGSPKAIGERP
jgi:hypothetical protein